MSRDFFIVIILLVIAVVVGWFGKDVLGQKKLLPAAQITADSILNPTTYPDLSDIKLMNPVLDASAGGILGKSLDTLAGGVDDSEGIIQLLSVHAVMLYDEVEAPQGQATQKKYRVVGVRLMGEVKNIGQEVVKAVAGSITFYGKKDQFLSSKKGYFNPSTVFLPLKTDEIGVFDFIVRDPPKDLEKLELRLKVVTPESGIDWIPLKVKDKSLTSQVTGSGSAQLVHYQFHGLVINDQSKTIEAPTVLVWIKNKEGKVVMLQTQSYTDDLISANKEFPVSFLIRSNELIAKPVFEVRTVGKKYEK